MVLAEAGLPRGQEPNPAQRAHPVANSRPAATRVRRVPWRDSARRVPWRVLVLDALPAAETLVPRFCDSGRSIPRNGPPASSRPGIPMPSDSATSIDAAYAVERDVARRLAQRCTPQPHSWALLKNSLLRMRLSLPRFITSLQFCCAGWALTRGRELSGERPRTLI